MNRSERMQRIVAQGWIVMFIVFLANIVMDLARIAVTGTQAQWTEHLGMPGVKFILMLMSVYALMPILVGAISARWFRFVVVGMSILMTLFVGAHEISHLMVADKPFGLLHALDITHHIVGLWVIVAAILWVRAPD